MKIYEKIVIDMESGDVLEEQSYDYSGPVAKCDFGGGGGGGDPEAAAAVIAAATREAAKMQKEMYEQTRADMGPYREAGTQTLPYYSGILGIPGYDRVDPTEALRSTPGYNFMMDQGTEALNRRAAATGQLGSGAAAKGLLQYGQGLGDQTYNNYMNRLYNMVTGGQNAAAQTGQFGMQSAGNAGNYLMQGAQAQANMMMQPRQQSSGWGDLMGGLGLLGGIGMMPVSSFKNSLFGSFF